MREPSSPARQVRAILRRELVAARGALLGWLAPTAGVLAMTIGVFPEMSKRGSLLEAKLESLPKGMLAAFGMQQLELSDPAAYLATNFSLVVLLGAVFAALLGATILTKEEALRTAELLLVQPVDRRTLVVAKGAAGVSVVIAFDVALLLVALGTFAAIGVALPAPGVVVALFLGAALVHACVLAIAFAATAALARPRAATSVGLGAVFGLYGAGVVAALAPAIDFVGVVSPFTWAQPHRIVAAGGLPASAAALPLVTVAAIALAALSYARKDIHA